MWRRRTWHARVHVRRGRPRRPRGWVRVMVGHVLHAGVRPVLSIGAVDLRWSVVRPRLQRQKITIGCCTIKGETRCVAGDQAHGRTYGENNSLKPHTRATLKVFSIVFEQKYIFLILQDIDSKESANRVAHDKDFLGGVAPFVARTKVRKNDQCGALSTWSRHAATALQRGSATRRQRCSQPAEPRRTARSAVPRPTQIKDNSL